MYTTEPAFGYETQLDSDLSQVVANEQSLHLSKRIGNALLRRALKLSHVTSALRQDETQPLAAINRWHGFAGLFRMEGFMCEEQAQFFVDLLAAEPAVKNIAEIGFNGGHSSSLFLGARADTKVTSFDIGDHSYVETTAAYIQSQFGDRHELCLGDSKTSVPEYSANNPDTKFDLIFIDGGHDSGTARADLNNMRSMAHKDTLVVMDDCMEWVSYGVGPHEAWNEAVRRGAIAQEAIIPAEGRAWAVGKYLHVQ